MSDQKSTLTREQLYEVVWTKPATHIALDYGVSAAAVLKACDQLDVPRPGRGHWAKLEHGKEVTRTPLPPLKEGGRTSTTLADLHAGTGTSPSGDQPAPPSPVIEDARTETHALARKTLAAYRGGEKHYRHGTLAGKKGFPHLRLAVTRECLDRAVEIYSRLAWMLERNGFAFETHTESDRFLLTHTATKMTLDVSVQEIIERHERKPTEKEKSTYYFKEWDYQATGRLRFVISEFFPEGARKSWADGKQQKLEDKLTEIVEGCIICADGKHAQELKWAERDRYWAEEEKRRKEAEACRAAEKSRHDLFRAEAVHWAEAQRLRDFRLACEASLRTGRPDGSLNREEEQWLRWSADLIARIDPLSRDYLTKAVSEYASTTS